MLEQKATFNEKLLSKKKKKKKKKQNKGNTKHLKTKQGINQIKHKEQTLRNN